jgi:hypothetical protein
MQKGLAAARGNPLAVTAAILARSCPGGPPVRRRRLPDGDVDRAVFLLGELGRQHRAGRLDERAAAWVRAVSLRLSGNCLPC